MIRLNGHSTELDAIAVCSLVATAFILFVFPQATMASLRIVLGGYIVSFLCGMVGYGLIQWLAFIHVSDVSVETLNMLMGTFALVFAMVAMIGLKVKYPPALGLALGIAIIPWDASALMIIGIAVMLIAILKKILYPYLHTL